MNIEIGKAYRSRDGHKWHTPMKTGETTDGWPLWMLSGPGGSTANFYEDGRFFFNDGDAVHGFDLVAEWSEKPPVERAADVFAPKVLPPVRVTILHEGAELTNGSRDVEYGPPGLNMAAAGELKQVFRKHLRRNISPAELEAVDLALTKLGRIATGLKPKRDTYVDCATYVAIAGEIALTEIDNL